MTIASSDARAMLQIVVDNSIVVQRHLVDLPGGIGQPFLDLGLVIEAPGAQPALELLGRRRQDEDRDRGRRTSA